MARTLTWSENAVQDLEEVARFIGKDSPFYASSFVREARAAAKSLKTLSERGRIVPEIGETNVREIFLKSYRLIYRIEKNRIFVLAFIHGARDLSALWKRRE